MALTSKTARELQDFVNDTSEEFDFGEPEIVTVEVAKGKFLSMREPSAEDLMSIDSISRDKNISEIESTLKIICILHSPNPNGRKLTLKDAKRLTGKQIELLGVELRRLLNIGGEAEEDSKSTPDPES